MSIFFDAPVGADALTGFVRDIPRTSYFGPRFSTELVNDTEVPLGKVTRSNGVARYRSFDGRIHVANRGIASEAKVKLPALSDSLSQGEYETLQLAFAKTGGTRTEALAQAIYNDAETLTRNVHNRLDLAVGEVLSTGRLSLTNETDGFAAEVDYGVPAGNLPTAQKVWTDPSADIVGDLTAWTDAYAGLNGTGPATILMDRTVLRAMQRNAGLIGFLGGTGRTQIPTAELLSLIEGEFGVQIETVAGSYDVDGVQTPVIKADRISFLPGNPDDLLKITLGVTVTALELVGSNAVDLDFQEAPGIVGVVIKEGPPFRQFTFVDAVGMPTVKNANLLFSAKVK